MFAVEEITSVPRFAQYFRASVVENLFVAKVFGPSLGVIYDDEGVPLIHPFENVAHSAAPLGGLVRAY
ncbi:unknown [Bacteroides sp. CAG:144]|nr:unknown [Bacteroides sp. CAG:144]